MPNFPSLAFLAVVLGVACTGCQRLHIEQSVTLEVVNPLTGACEPGMQIYQGVQQSYFEPSLRSIAVTDAQGTAVFPVIRCVGWSWWTIGDECDYHAEPPTQIPAAFVEMRLPGGGERFRVPYWPMMTIRMEIPDGFTGSIALWRSPDDASRASAWFPNSAVARTALFDATIVADASGAATFPSTLDGWRGVSFHTRAPIERTGSMVPVHTGELDHLPSDGDALAQELTRRAAWPLSWIRSPADDARGNIVPATRLRAAWFVGTRGELHAWLAAHELAPELRMSWRNGLERVPYRSLRFKADALVAALPPSQGVSAPPVWSVRTQPDQ